MGVHLRVAEGHEKGKMGGDLSAQGWVHEATGPQYGLFQQHDVGLDDYTGGSSGFKRASMASIELGMDMSCTGSTY